MNRFSSFALLAVLALPLGGCVAGLAAGAVGMAARGMRGEPQSNAHLRSDASTACTAEASKRGTARVIDVEHRSPTKLVVWGTVDDASGRQSFECSYGTKITGFKLRPIAAAR